MSKGALVVGVAASAAVVSGAEFSNTPSHNEVPTATPIVSTSPVTRTTAPAPTEPKRTDAPSAKQPAGPAQPEQAPSVTPKASLPHGEIPGVIKECVEKYLALREAGDSATNGERESTGAVCKAALAASGLSGADFWAKFGPQTYPPKPEPTANTEHHEYTPEVMHWIQECVTKYTHHAPDASATCIKAITLTGLTSSQFAEKFLKLTGENKPSTSPSAKPASAELEQLIYVCRKLQGAITDASTGDQANAAGAACDKAIGASGLGTDDFWKKWPPLKPTTPVVTPKPSATTKPVTNTAELAQLVARCLDLYKTITSTGGDTRAASDACRIAIQASGLSSADFWAKYHPTTN